MKVNSEQEDLNNLFWMLRELDLKVRARRSAKENVTYYFQEPSSKVPAIEDQIRSLIELSNQGALTLSKRFHRDGWNNIAISITGGKAIGYDIQINQPRFDLVFKNTKEKYNKQGIERVEYIYNESTSSGILIIDTIEIPFSKHPGRVLQFYFENKKASYKNFHDFNSTSTSPINSVLFRNSIEHINNRVSQFTKKRVKEIILKQKKSDQKANLYHWNLDPL